MIPDEMHPDDAEDAADRTRRFKEWERNMRKLPLTPAQQIDLLWEYLRLDSALIGDLYGLIWEVRLRWDPLVGDDQVNWFRGRLFGTDQEFRHGVAALAQRLNRTKSQSPQNPHPDASGSAGPEHTDDAPGNEADSGPEDGDGSGSW